MFRIESFKPQAVDQPDFSFLNLSGRKFFYAQKYYGQGITVAVVDTGVSPHAEFGSRLLPGKNFCSNYSDKNSTEDDDGHGTHVASSIAGQNCGIAPKVQILPVKVINGMGIGEIPDIISALNWLKDQDVDIVNMSLGCPVEGLSPDLLEQFHQTVKGLTDKGIVVIAAAGNTGREDTIYPGAFEEPIAVGAVSKDKQVAYFSTRSPEVDLCQVGVDVPGAWYKGGYAVLSGTSMATPMISGIAALIACKYKALFGKKIPEMALYESLKINTIDLDTAGVDHAAGAGFCTLNPWPVHMEMTIDKPRIRVNSEEIFIDQAPIIMNSRTLLPVRAIVENICGTAIWDQATRKVTIDI